jgi:hypothetical protein
MQFVSQKVTVSTETNSVLVASNLLPYWILYAVPWCLGNAILPNRPSLLAMCAVGLRLNALFTNLCYLFYSSVSGSLLVWALTSVIIRYCREGFV